MILKKYGCRKFAGISDKDMEFDEGLNVLLGPNEAGKSTVVEGIYAVLFKAGKVGNLTKDDKDFRRRFMPLPSGDSIDGEVIISGGDGDYLLRKEWGENFISELVLPDSSRVRSEDAISDLMRGLLRFGEGTYRGIVFARQAQIKSAIDEIVRNKEATDEVGSLLRKAIMELDGVSLSDLAGRIDEKIKALTGKWDMERECPENNRGINNPFKRGTGDIINSYYEREKAGRDMNAASLAEERMENLLALIEKGENEVRELKKRIAEMEGLEQDVQKRLRLQPKKESLAERLKGLSQINRQWPQKELLLDLLEKEIGKMEKRREALDEEIRKAESLVEKKNLARRLEKVRSLEKDVQEKKKKAGEMKEIAIESIRELESASQKMNTAKAKMEAGTMLAVATGLNEGVRMYAATGMEQAAEIFEGEEIRAKGYIRLESDSFGKMEIRSGNIDFDRLREEFESGREKRKAIAERLGIGSVQEARDSKAERDRLLREIEAATVQIGQQLDGESAEELSARIEAFGDLDGVRDPALTAKEHKGLGEELIEKKAEKRSAAESIEKWRGAYGDLDGLLQALVEVKRELGETESELAEMKALPEEFESAEDFMDRLRESRIGFRKTMEDLAELKEDYLDLEREKPDLTYEELEKLYREEDGKFGRSVAKAKKLMAIRDAFHSTKESMDGDSYRPVIESFSKYISVLTDEAYAVSEMDEDFNPVIAKGSGAVMPVDLLSSGTYDSVALALRLAILDNILKEARGFMVLDDCLVDLDPERKERAVMLIREFSKSHQVIFTTCSPETSSALGGNIIKM